MLSGYSLRDAISLKTAISEMHRVLKEDGKWVIVDLGKPDESFFRFGVTFYLRMILPIIALQQEEDWIKVWYTLWNIQTWPQNKNWNPCYLRSFQELNLKKILWAEHYGCCIQMNNRLILVYITGILIGISYASGLLTVLQNVIAHMQIWEQ